MIRIFVFLRLLSLVTAVTVNETLTRLAFGSCHKTKRPNPQIWRSIANLQPQAWLWLGDAVYPPTRKIANLTLLEESYQQMFEPNIGYKQHLLDNMKHQRVFGTWDDHDFGANDAGNSMPGKAERARLFNNFLGTETNTDRNGVYDSITWQDKVQILTLDTRWHRGEYCIPSVATKFPLGAGIACMTRWLTAGLLFPYICKQDKQKQTVLGEEQWQWLEHEIESSTAAMHVIVSSIQVLTTNPTLESWGHFPTELERLLTILNKASGTVLILSGDVHYAELIQPNKLIKADFPFLEVTSSGMTHTCKNAIYGFMCEPLLKMFQHHRQSPLAYYYGKNFGTLDIDWTSEPASYTVNVHDTNGTIVLSTGPRSMTKGRHLTDREIRTLSRACWNQHLQPYAQGVVFIFSLFIIYRFGIVNKGLFHRRISKRAQKSTRKRRKVD